MAGKNLGPCLIEHCPNLRRVRSPICATCSGNFRYWEKRGAKAILDRQGQLEKWQDRMQYMGQRDDQPKEFRNAARTIEKRRVN